MAVTIEFFDSTHVMFVQYTGRVDNETVGHVLSQYTKLCLLTTAPIHIICDVAAMIGIPRNLLHILHLYCNPRGNPNAGAFVMITTDMLMQKLIGAFLRIVPQARVYCVQSIEQGLDMMEQILGNEEVSLTAAV
jgi:hypothetical protein